MELLQDDQKWSHYCPDNIFLSLLDPIRQVTFMPIVETRPKLNLSKILCMSSLSAILTKIQSEMKPLSARQYFPHYMSMGAQKGR